MATAKQAHVKLAGRFPAGTDVELVKVKDERVLRTSAGDKVVASGTVGDDGSIEFSKGVEVGGRYFIRATVDGIPREVRITGTESASAVLSQPPVGNDEVKIGSSGKTLAELAAEKEDVPDIEVHPAAKQSQARDVLQRSATPLGYATPLEEDEKQPYGEQGDYEGYEQRSDTEVGQATLVQERVERQEDTDGSFLQRSDTPHGVTTPIPAGGAVAATEIRDSSSVKDIGGTEPNKAATIAPDGPAAAKAPARKRSGAKKKAAKKKTSAPRKRSR